MRTYKYKIQNHKRNRHLQKDLHVIAHATTILLRCGNDTTGYMDNAKTTSDRVRFG